MGDQLKDLLLQALEAELGSVEIYTYALECALRSDLQSAWQKDLDQTNRRVGMVRDILTTLRIDPDEQTTGREIVQYIGESLLEAMEIAKSEGSPGGAELVACECALLTETKDRANWELLSRCATEMSGAAAHALRAACDAVRAEDHLFHTEDWYRELWLESLEIPAVSPSA